MLLRSHQTLCAFHQGYTITDLLDCLKLPLTWDCIHPTPISGQSQTCTGNVHTGQARVIISHTIHAKEVFCLIGDRYKLIFKRIN